MKRIQNLTHHEFSEKTVIIGDKVIGLTAIVLTFAFLVLPFLLLLVRLG